MNCEHKNTTLAWLYGEADEAHLHHIARCSACTRVVKTQSELLLLLPPIPQKKRTRRPLFAAALLAATALFFTWPLEQPPQGRATVPIVYEPSDPLLYELDALEAELDALEADLYTF